MDIFACIALPICKEIKNQRAIAKKTSQIMKWTNVTYPNGKWHKVLQKESTYPASCGTPASVNLDVKMTNN